MGSKKKKKKKRNGTKIANVVRRSRIYHRREKGVIKKEHR